MGGDQSTCMTAEGPVDGSIRIAEEGVKVAGSMLREVSKMRCRAA